MVEPIFSQYEIDRINEAIERETALFIRDIPDKVNAILNEGIMSAMGFTRRYGKIEIDHQSAASKYITAVAVDALQKLIKSKLTVLLAEARKKAYDTALQAEFVRAYKDEYSRQVREAASNQAKADVADLMSRVKLRNLRNVDDFNRELESPSGFATAVGEAMLEVAVEQGMMDELPKPPTK